jgi:hypothetical protein
MRQGRWIAVAVGFAAAVTLAAPAGAGVKVAATDKAILHAGVLTAADGVPSTWTSAKQTDTGSKQFKGIASCKQIAAAMDLARRGPRAFSPKFSDPAATSSAEAENSVYAFKTVKAAQRYLSPYEASNVTTCLEQSLKKAVGGKAQVTVAPISNLQGVGDQSVGFEASITVTDQSGNPVHVIADVIGVRVRRAFVGFDFSNNDVSLPQGPSIVNTVVSRLTSTVNG